MAKWAAVSLIAMMAAVAILAGNYYRVLDRVQARDFTFPQQWAVAEVHPEFGEGIPSESGEARIAEGGTLQVLSSGGACDALAGVEVEESDETVRVTVRRVDVPVGALPPPERHQESDQDHEEYAAAHLQRAEGVRRVGPGVGVVAVTLPVPELLRAHLTAPPELPAGRRASTHAAIRPSAR